MPTAATIEFDAEITTSPTDGRITVRAIAIGVPGLDRPESWAWEFGRGREALARRLGKAIKACKAVVCADGIGPDGRPASLTAGLVLTRRTTPPPGRCTDPRAS